MVVSSTTSRALWHFNDDGQRVQLARPELPAPHYICMYRLLPTIPLITIYALLLPTYSRYQFTDPKGWIAWLAKANCTHITFAQGYYTIEIKGTGRKWTQVVGSKTNSIQWTTTPNVKAQEINLWTCWAIRELNHGPFARAASGLTTGPPWPHNTVKHNTVLLYNNTTSYYIDIIIIIT